MENKSAEYKKLSFIQNIRERLDGLASECEKMSFDNNANLATFMLLHTLIDNVADLYHSNIETTLNLFEDSYANDVIDMTMSAFNSIITIVSSKTKPNMSKQLPIIAEEIRSLASQCFYFLEKEQNKLMKEYKAKENNDAK